MGLGVLFMCLSTTRVCEMRNKVSATQEERPAKNHSMPMLFSAAALAIAVISLTAVAGTKDLPSLWGRHHHCVRPQHCGHLRNAGQTSSGVYTIYPSAARKSGQRVFCDMETDGGDWTVIQRRGQFGNSIYYFFRNWSEYASGFGDVEKEYWIGNHALHALTSGADEMSLRVVLNRSSSESVSVDYRRFKIASEEDFFRISVGDFKGEDGWDAFRNVDGMPFSTFDKTIDGDEPSCGKLYLGAWWYTFNCHGPNLNGVNYNGKHLHEDFPTNSGIQWNNEDLPEGVDMYRYSYPSVLMMIRPTEGLPDGRRR